MSGATVRIRDSCVFLLILAIFAYKFTLGCKFGAVEDE